MEPQRRSDVKKKAANKDRRITPTFMVRLRRVYHEAITAATKRTRRTMTAEIEVALEKHLAEMGLWPPGGEK